MTLQLSLIRVPHPSRDQEGELRGVDEAFRVTNANFRAIRALIDRANKGGTLLAPGSSTLAGDVTGLMGATTVEKIRNASVPAPTASENLHLLRYSSAGVFTWETIQELIDDILTTSGDLLYRTGSSITRLGVGSAYSILAVNAGATAPAYATLGALIDAVFGNTRGSILYRGASGWALLNPDTAGYVLTDGGVGADPSWAAASGGVPPTDFDLLTDGVSSLIFAGGDVVWIV